MAAPRIMLNLQKLDEISESTTKAGEKLTEMLKLLQELVLLAENVMKENKVDAILAGLQKINAKLLPQKPADRLKQIKPELDKAKLDLNMIEAELQLAGTSVNPSHKSLYDVTLKCYEATTANMKASGETYQVLLKLIKAIADRAKTFASAPTPAPAAAVRLKVGT